jgi:hypothetical protein
MGRQPQPTCLILPSISYVASVPFSYHPAAYDLASIHPTKMGCSSFKSGRRTKGQNAKDQHLGAFRLDVLLKIAAETAAAPSPFV